MSVSTGAIVVIVVAVVVVVGLVIGVLGAMRRRRLQQRFGPEYDRLVGERDSRLKAEAELTQRERRVQDLHIRPLTDSARAGYADQWAAIQEQFVDAPADAVAASQLLVAAVMNERGYPTEHRDQVLADLSVEHASTLDRYRAAEEISENAASGTASTEDLRLAMIHYRALFRELLGEPAEPAETAAEPAEPAPVGAAPVDEGAPAEAAPVGAAPVGAAPEPAETGAATTGPAQAAVPDDTQAADIRDPVTAEEPVGDGRADIPAQRTPRS
jgi:Tfp pilus assembly protein PilX